MRKAYDPAVMPQTETEISEFFTEKSLVFFRENKLAFLRDRVANFWLATTLFIHHSRLKMPADLVTLLIAGLAIDTISRQKGKVRLALIAAAAIAANLLLGLFLVPLKELVKAVF